MKRKLILNIALLLLALPGLGQKSEVFVTEKGAIQGYDPVAYFTEGKPIEGKKELAYRYKEQEWHFSSQKNLDLFKSNPEKYEPQYGGYCAFGMSRGYKAKTDPIAWTIVNDKLYLNYNTEVRTEWNKKQAEFIEKANSNWGTIKDKE